MDEDEAGPPAGRAEEEERWWGREKGWRDPEMTGLQRESERRDGYAGEAPNAAELTLVGPPDPGHRDPRLCSWLQQGGGRGAGCSNHSPRGLAAPFSCVSASTCTSCSCCCSSCSSALCEPAGGPRRKGAELTGDGACWRLARGPRLRVKGRGKRRRTFRGEGATATEAGAVSLPGSLGRARGNQREVETC